MGRRQVVEIQCSRCDRTETQPGKLETTPPHVLLAELVGNDGEDKVIVKFEDLCTPCRRTVKALLEQIGKRIDGLSPDRHTKPAPAPAKKPEAKEKGAANGTAPHPAQPAAHPAGSKTATAASR
jgi:hypothetical protein